MRNRNRLQAASCRPQDNKVSLSKIILKRVFVVFVACSLLLAATKAGFAEKIEIKQTPEGGYILYLDGKPTLLKAVIYNPTPIGEGYDYNFFTDESKPWLYDGKLMKELGINSVRIYSSGDDLQKVKEFIRDMHERFGIYTIMSDWLGLWSYPAANYADEEFKKKIKEKVLRTVKALKDEEGLLMWVLGNENNYTFSGKIGFWTSQEIESISDYPKRIAKKAEIYYSFVDDLAGEIKKIDKVHPVALGNGEASFLDVASRVSKNIDVLAVIAYRGKKFGNLFRSVRTFFDKPILISEFGADSYNAYSGKKDEGAQAEFLLSQWEDIYNNAAFSGNNKGNSIGGITFEWTDEWWKHNEGYASDWLVHNKEAGWSQGAYYFDIKAKNNLNMNEEWFGLIGITEDKEGGINKRVPKKAFYTLKDFFSQLPSKNPKSQAPNPK